MLKHIYKYLGIALLTVVLLPDAVAQIEPEDVGTEKLAQTSFKFLKVSPDARAAAMGGGLIASDLASPVAMFYNPAGMARLERFGVSFGLTQWIADINYSAISAAYNTNGYGVFGVSLMFAEYGDHFIGTIQDGSDPRGYREYSELGLSDPKPSAYAVGLGYAAAITDRFSVGGNVKIASQDLGTALVSDGVTESAEETALAFDFGVLYKTGFRSLNLALTVRNFAQELNYVDENFELPLTFNVGVAMDLMDFRNMESSDHSLVLSVEAERPRDFAEQVKIGGEYSFSNILFLRAGYIAPTDEEGINLGAGLRYDLSGVGVGVDYSFTSFGVFDNVQRFGFQLTY
ncbi:MAG: PorV/PorQ family protein [Rhodothermales bacterium]|nr:PorV/PorQ family protein [Rhodothermales bacterium]